MRSQTLSFSIVLLFNLFPSKTPRDISVQALCGHKALIQVSHLPCTFRQWGVGHTRRARSAGLTDLRDLVPQTSRNHTDQPQGEGNLANRAGESGPAPSPPRLSTPNTWWDGVLRGHHHQSPYRHHHPQPLLLFQHLLDFLCTSVHH